MLRFQLAPDDRLHFASKASYQTEKGSAFGLLIMTDKRLFFGDVSNDFQFELNLADITAIIVEPVPERRFLFASRSERLVITERKIYEFLTDDAHAWRKEILRRPVLLDLFMQYRQQEQE